jgi:N-acetylneuraminic acid mutarotase
VTTRPSQTRSLLPRAAIALTITLGLAACSQSAGQPGGQDDNPDVGTATLEWKAGTSLPFATAEGAAVAAGQDIYLITHDNKTLRLRDGVWTEVGAGPGVELDHSGLAYSGGQLYAVGGLQFGWPGVPSNKLWKWNDATNKWEDTGKNLNTPRGGHATVGTGNRIYVFGGITGTGASGYSDTASVEYIDVQNVAQGWQTVNPGLSVARDHLTAQAVDGRIYVIGGRAAAAGQIASNFNAVRGEVDVFQASTGARLDSDQTPDLPKPRGGMGSALVAGKIVVFGGEGAVTGSIPGLNVFDLTQVLDPVTGTWAEVAALPTPRHGIASASTPDNVGHAIGGSKQMASGHEHDTNEHHVVGLK